MELHQLRYFVAVAETGSFTRAAGREGVTQPTLSEQVIKLEKALARRLFDRLGRKVVLTDAGHDLLGRAQAILTAVGDAERAVRDAVDGGRLRAGAIPTVAPFLLPPAVSRFVAEHPGVHLQLQEERTERLLADLLAGDLDLGVMALPVRDDRLHVEPLFAEDLVTALPAGHRLAAKAEVKLADVVDEPFILLDDVHCFGDQVLSFCRRGGMEPRVVCRGEQIATLLAMVSAGLGVSVVPAMAAAGGESPGRVFRPLGKPTPTRTLCAVWHKQRYRPPSVRAFVAALSGEPPQELHPGRHVAELVVPLLPIDAQDAVELDHLERRRQGQPVDVAGPDRHLLQPAAEPAGPGVAGVGVDGPPLQRGQAGERVVAVQEEVGRVVGDAEAPAVVPGQVLDHLRGRVETDLQGDDAADPVAERPEGEQRLAHELGARGGRVVRQPGAGDHHLAGPEVEGELHRLADVVEAGLLVLGHVQPVPQRHVQGGQLLVVRPQQVAELPPAGVAEPVRGEVAGGVHLQPGRARPGDRRQGRPERQAGRFEDEAELERFHHGSLRRTAGVSRLVVRFRTSRLTPAVRQER